MHVIPTEVLLCAAARWQNALEHTLARARSLFSLRQATRGVHVRTYMAYTHTHTHTLKVLIVQARSRASRRQIDALRTSYTRRGWAALDRDRLCARPCYRSHTHTHTTPFPMAIGFACVVGNLENRTINLDILYLKPITHELSPLDSI